MAVELGPTGNLLRGVVGRVLHRGEFFESRPRLSSEKARQRREAYERKDARTYIGNVHLMPEGSSGLSREDWSFQESTPDRPLNPEADVAYGDHVLKTGDYLTIFGNGTVLWEGALRFYPDGRGFRHPLGVAEEYWLRLFSDGCSAELRTPVEAGTLAVGDADNAVFGGIQAKKSPFKI